MQSAGKLIARPKRCSIRQHLPSRTP